MNVMRWQGDTGWWHGTITRPSHPHIHQSPHPHRLYKQDRLLPRVREELAAFEALTLDCVDRLEAEVRALVLDEMRVWMCGVSLCGGFEPLNASTACICV